MSEDPFFKAAREAGHGASAKSAKDKADESNVAGTGGIGDMFRNFKLYMDYNDKLCVISGSAELIAAYMKNPGTTTTIGRNHQRKGEFRKVGENLYRYSSNHRYYAVFRVKGKLIWKSLKTSDREFTKTEAPYLPSALQGATPAMVRC